jgi:ABC-type antimicrobial peptide transport system permease subunit
MVQSLSTPALAGFVAGTVVSLWASRFVQSLLYDVNAQSPMTLVGATVVLTAVATLSAAVPAYRVSRVDPAQLLRET